MFSENFYEGLEAGLFKKEAFIGRAIGGGVKAVGKGLWNTAKFPFTGFAKGSPMAHLDKEFAWLGRNSAGEARAGLKGLGLQTVAGGAAISAPFAAMGAGQYVSRAGKSTSQAYNPARSNLMSPVTSKSPMGNIF